MGILNRAKRILKSQLNSALEGMESKLRPSAQGDPFDDGAATMDAEEWYQAARAKLARDAQQRDRDWQRSRPPHGSPAALPAELARAYANLDCPVGSDLKTVRAAWKRLMMKYHPDRFPNDAEKRKSAERLTALLNESYQKLEAHLEAGRGRG
ncbi:MAG: J domain-containing protein [Candidatus Riflebacteria bacterium]|nr:J domain-containing protein [Candidatus Riflebacteria bacterium]